MVVLQLVAAFPLLSTSMATTLAGPAVHDGVHAALAPTTLLYEVPTLAYQDTPKFSE